jgi:hypothetical protein
MVDQFGRWHVEEDYSTYPKNKWCAYDHIAVWIRSEGYEPLTTMENLIDMIFLYYEGECEEQDKEFSVEDCIEFVKDSGGIRKFDYRV